MGRLFGTDGVRVASRDQLRNSFSTGRRSPCPAERGGRMLVGVIPPLRYDVEAALVADNSYGVDVELLGIIPTPAVAYLTARRTTGNVAGAMISTSHNPIADNGSNFNPEDTNSDKTEAEIGLPEETAAAKIARPTGTGVGRVFTISRAEDEYLILSRAVKESLWPDGRSGPATAPLTGGSRILEALGAGFTPCTRRTTLRINVDCGHQPGELRQAVLEKGAQVGWPTTGTATE